MRLPLGPDCLHIVRFLEYFNASLLIYHRPQIRFKCETLLKDAKDWEGLSMSVLADDADPDFLSKLSPATRRK